MRLEWLILGLFIMTVGCASQVNPAPASTPAHTQAPHPQYETVDIRSVSGIAETELSVFYPADLTVDIFGEEVLLVPVRARPDSLEAEFPQLVSEAQQDSGLVKRILDDIQLKDSYLYMEPVSTSRVWVEFSVYKFNDPSSAGTVMDLYSRVWNTLNREYANGSIWIWEGWKGQVASGYVPDRYRAGAFCFWDPQNRVMLFSQQGVTNQVLGSPATDLLCLHGEQARGRYFFMADIHASPAIIDEVGDEVFAQIVGRIYSVELDETEAGTSSAGDNQTYQGLPQVEKEIRELKDQIIELARNYTSGEISYEEFSRRFAIYDERIKELESNSSTT
ncbi:MAG: hypothetical protein GXP49_08690 [Deltaproteobacteria bacterium]|nr:hypothetical protein [Deltaproteobacteria bacterium]